MSPWERLLERPHARGHVVQLYQPGDERPLVRSVSLYLSEGLKRGEGALVIASTEHREGFVRELSNLGVDPASAIRRNRLVCRDAQETLSQFMVAGQPHWDKFELAVGAVMREVRPVEAQTGLRAYGEMVGLLWQARQFAAAIRLEQFWNKLLTRSSFNLYCAYSIDIFEKEFQVQALDGILCTHSHLMPSEPRGNLEAAIDSAMDEVLGTKGDALKVLIKSDHRSSWAVIPKGEAAILWLRRNLPDQAEHVIARAREYYERSIRQGHPAFADQ